jgi:hypothetical protein
VKKALPFKALDLVMILIALALTGFSAFAVYARPQSTTQVLIEGPNGRWIFPLDAEETISVPGPLGQTVVRIHNHEAWVESSPCENQTCIAAGHVNEQGDWVACLPNNVFLMIEGRDDLKNVLDSGAW